MVHSCFYFDFHNGMNVTSLSDRGTKFGDKDPQSWRTDVAGRSGPAARPNGGRPYHRGRAAYTVPGVRPGNRRPAHGVGTRRMLFRPPHVDFTPHYLAKPQPPGRSCTAGPAETRTPVLVRAGVHTAVPAVRADRRRRAIGTRGPAGQPSTGTRSRYAENVVSPAPRRLHAALSS